MKKNKTIYKKINLLCSFLKKKEAKNAALIKIRLQQAPLNRIKINLINTANFAGGNINFFFALSLSLWLEMDENFNSTT